MKPRFIASALMAGLLVAGCATTMDERRPVNEPVDPVATPDEPRPEPARMARQELTAEEAEQRFRSLEARPYVVEKGDTLWDIAAHFLENPLYWPEIWHDNPHIANPHLIYPGDRIEIVYKRGVPRLTVTLSPRMRAEPLPPPIPVLPLDLLRPYLNYDQVLTEEDFENAPYILRARDPITLISAGDTVYVRPALEDGVVNYSVLRPGEALVDPETGETLGLRAIFAGELRMVRRGDPTVLEVEEATRDIRQGDRLFRMPSEPFTRDVVPTIPEWDIRGQVMFLPDAMSQVGRNQVVVINRGAQDGLEVGNLLEIHERGGLVADDYSRSESDRERAGNGDIWVRLPNVPTGALMLFRVYDRVSYGLILESKRPVQVGDLVVTPDE
ncbi:MAG: LysM peptidoglycan-binding domain-containing protein [Halothiobacillaceae bacterium]